MVYVLNFDNYCYQYLLSSVVLPDDVSISSFGFVYSELKQRFIGSQVPPWRVGCRRLTACVRAKGEHFKRSLL